VRRSGLKTDGIVRHSRRPDRQCNWTKGTRPATEPPARIVWDWLGLPHTGSELAGGSMVQRKTRIRSILSVFGAVITAFVFSGSPAALAALSSACSYPRGSSSSDFCYTFRVIHETCHVGRATNWGCQQGREYKWTAGCVGWFDVYHPGPKTKCFKSRLTDAGACSETKSLPPGGQIPALNLQEWRLSVAGPLAAPNAESRVRTIKPIAELAALRFGVSAVNPFSLLIMR
jgi:hypothetical protein